MQLYNIKRLAILFVSFLFGHSLLFGQVTITQPPGVETYTIKKEGVTDAVQIATLTNAEKIRSINYMDGLGRPIQSIVAAGSPNGKDIVSFAKYDVYGRQNKQYLPFEAATSTGAYNAMGSVEADQIAFYNPNNAAAKKIANDNGPYYAESIFETSPMSRVIKAGGVGQGFEPVINQHFKTLNYRNNTSADNVHKWVLGSNAATGTANYAADELVVSEVVDENNITSTVFKDKFSRLILKRQSGYDTYYVYDNIGNIVFIVPPKAIVNMIAANNFNTSFAPELIFQFWYDSKNRIIRKKVPGSTEVYMVYDPLGRVVLTQDGNMRKSSPKKWAYVKYDIANRVIIQGIYTNNNSLTQMQFDVDNEPCYSTTSSNFYEIRQSGTSSGYSNQCFPTPTSTTTTEERGYNYFDNYDFDFDGNPDYSKEDQGLTDEATATNLTYGLATGSKTKILGSGTPGTWLVNVSFYDKYYHVIQVRSNNQIRTTVTDHTTNVVNFAGQAQQAKQVKTINDPYGYTGTLQIEVSTRYEYDDMGRLLKVKQTNPGAAEVIVAKYEYNPLGQLVDKKLHSTNNGVNYLQSVDMRYNIRGQLLSINNSDRNINADNNDETNDVFGMEILYDKPETGLNTPRYDGMISAIKWSAGQTGSPVNSALRSYKYTYDNLYRLTASQYQEKKFGSWTQNQGGFNESMSYDENGNIASLQRYAILGSTVTQIDNLTYNYKNGGLSNQLERIDDAIPTNATGYGFRNFTGTNPTTPYVYDDGIDGNGNLTNDPKKGTTITYNELNKPTLIQISGTKKVEYRYDASGTRISKIVTNNSATKTIEYIGGYVIENDVLSYYSMAEGRVRNEGGGYGLSMKMEYFITDHQGNTRVSFEDDGTNTNTAHLTQENSYYAFGMQMAGSYMPTNANKKLYNAGSEWQDDIDGLADYYSTFYREYDPVIGRFNGVDPMAEVTDNMTTYAYANNNPIMMNDPMGNYAAGKQPEQWILDMQADYKEWHDSRYGDSYSARGGWNFDGDGGGGGGGGGVGTYYRGFGSGNNYFGNNSTSRRQFWQSMLDLGGEFASQQGQDILHITRGEDGEFGYRENYSNYGSTSKKVIVGTRWVSLSQLSGGPLYSSMDAAAIGWARNGGDNNTRTNFIEYSSVIFSTKKNGKTYYGYTPYESFEGIKGKDPTISSPGPGDILNRRHLPIGAIVVAGIHAHPNKGSNPNNFSKTTFAQFGDEGVMSIFPSLEFYLVTPDGKLFSASQGNQYPKVKGFPDNPQIQWDQLSTKDVRKVGWWSGRTSVTIWP